MANARKCDRCGKCFDPLHMDGMMCRFRNPVFQTSNDIREGVAGKMMLNDPDGFVDLCPECAEMFDAFMCGCDLPKKAEDKKDEENFGSDTDGDNIYLPWIRMECFRSAKEFLDHLVRDSEQAEREDETK